MPDRVSIPKGVSREYKSICQQIEERQPPTLVARSVVSKIDKNIREHGKGGEELINQMAPYMSPLVDKGSLLSYIPAEIDNALDEIERKKDSIEIGNRRYTEQAAQACKRVIIDATPRQISDDIVMEADIEFKYRLWQSEIRDPLLLAESEQTYEDKRFYLDKVDQAVAGEIENRLLNGYRKPDTLETLDVDIFSEL